MIATLIHVGWINLKRDPAALTLTFVLPIAFFSIFAAIFAGRGGGVRPAAIDVVAVDLDGSVESRRLIALLAAEDGLRLPGEAGASNASDILPADREAALAAVREGTFGAAIVVPPRFGATLGSFLGDRPTIEVIFDTANPMAEHMVGGLIQATAFRAAPAKLMHQGIAQLESFGGPLTPEQRTAVDRAAAILGGENDGAETNVMGSAMGMVTVETTPARQDAEAERPSIVPYYAAGIGVMFLLFSMTGAAGGLLDAAESGILDRLLASRVGMGRLLLGNWLFFSAMGFVQVMLMFVWGALVFGLDLFVPRTLVPTLGLSLVTAAAAAAFGLMLAATCRTRAQLGGISTVVILLMSALGGSMVPRFIMPESVQRFSKLTFNGWALDGYLKIFWYGDPERGVLGTLAALLPELGVLFAVTIVLLGGARLIARRWEAA